MRNFKKMALGLLIAVLAVGFSAFKSVTKKVDPDWVYVQTDDDEYTRISFATYIEGYCEDESEKPCAFIQDNDETDHGETLSYAAAQGISSLTPTESEGLYVPIP